jgi:hypothetical protein
VRKIQLSDAALIAEIASAIAVVLSLIFVAYQLSRNTQALFETNHFSLLEIGRDQQAWLKDPAFADIVLRAESEGGVLTPQEFRQYAEWVDGTLNLCETVYFVRTGGNYPDAFWRAWNVACGELFNNPTARKVWEERRTNFSADFAAWLNGKLEMQSGAPVEDAAPPQ